MVQTIQVLRDWSNKSPHGAVHAQQQWSHLKVNASRLLRFVGRVGKSVYSTIVTNCLVYLRHVSSDLSIQDFDFNSTHTSSVQDPSELTANSSTVIFTFAILQMSLQKQFNLNKSWNYDITVETLSSVSTNRSNFLFSRSINNVTFPPQFVLQKKKKNGQILNMTDFKKRYQVDPTK